MAFPTGWTLLQTLETDHTKVGGASDLTDIPILIKDGNLSSDVYSNIEADGRDLRFTTDEAGTTEIPFEIVSITPGSSLCQIWIKIPTLSWNNSTYIYVWGDNSGATAYAADDPYGSENVWGAVYKGAWHQEDAEGATRLDSTANDHDLADNNTVLQTTGKIDNAASLGTGNTNKMLNIADNLDITGGSITISAVVKIIDELVATGNYGLYYQQDATTDTTYYIRYYYDAGGNYIRFARVKQGVAANYVDYTINLGTSDFHHIVLRYDGVNVTGDVDNNNAGDAAASGNGTNAVSSMFVIGAINGSSSFGSFISDETRVLNDDITDGQVETEYNNQISPSTFWVAATPPVESAIKGWKTLLGVGQG